MQKYFGGVKMHQSSIFHLETAIKDFDKYIIMYISNNIPKVRRNLKIHLEDECYNLVRYLYEAIYTKGNIRAKNITEMLVICSLIDHFLEQLKEDKNLNKKKLENSIFKLTEIKNMTRGWKESHEQKEKKC